MSKPTRAPGKAEVSRRNFLARGAAAGVGVVAIAGTGAHEAAAQSGNGNIKWDYVADVVVIGAGVAGLPAAITARDNGASVIIVDENFDIGGRGILSGGRVQVGGGHALQQKLGIKDTPDMLFNDWVRFDHPESRYSDRDLIRVFADENVPTYDFLIENGVEFIEKPIRSPDASTVDRIFVTKEWHIPSQVYAPRRGRNGSGLVRRMEESARKKGVQIFLKHKMTSIVREKHNAGRVLGIITIAGSNPVNIQARKGVIIASGGHTGNVNFRRIFDPRLTEEYQQACSPYVHQGADGELAAMDIGASLWSTANQTADEAAQITKTRHIGCRWGYSSLVYEPDSPMFQQARATGLTVRDWQNMIFVNQNGKRFWDETDGSHGFFTPRWRITATRPSSTAAARSGRSSTLTLSPARNGSRSRRTSTVTAISSAPTPSRSSPPASRTLTRRRRSRARRCRKPSTATTDSSRPAQTRTSRSRRRSTRSKSRRSMRHGPRRSCTTR